MTQHDPESVDAPVASPPIGSPSAETRPEARLHRASLVVAFASMGVIGATIPAAIPGSATRMHVSSEELLPGVSALFLGLFVGVVIVAVMRRPERPFLIMGFVLQCAGLALLAASSSPSLFFLACTLSGIGFGLVETSATALTRAFAARGTPGHLAALNGAAAVAAALSPLFIAAFLSDDQKIPIAVLCAIPLIGVIVAWFGVPRRPAFRVAAESGKPPMPFRSLAVAGVALFFFVGAETVLSGWSSVLPQRLLGVPAEQAALGTSVFWVLVAAGRFVCAGLLRRGIAPERYLVAVLVGAGALAAAGAIVREGPVAAVLGGAVTVLIAPVYALLLGVALTHVGDDRSVPRVSGALVAVGSAGGVFLSFAVALEAGSAPLAVFFCVAVLLAVCVVFVLADLRRSR